MNVLEKDVKDRENPGRVHNNDLSRYITMTRIVVELVIVQQSIPAEKAAMTKSLDFQRRQHLRTTMLNKTDIS